MPVDTKHAYTDTISLPGQLNVSVITLSVTVALVALIHCMCLSVDIVPEEHRRLPGDVLRDGLLDAARVRRRLVPWQPRVEASPGAHRHHARAPAAPAPPRLRPAAGRQRRRRARWSLSRPGVPGATVKRRRRSQVLPEVRE